MYISKALHLIATENKLQGQADLAKLIGVSQGMISNYLAGRNRPTIGVAAYLYQAYGYQIEPYTELSLKSYIERYGPLRKGK